METLNIIIVPSGEAGPIPLARGSSRQLAPVRSFLPELALAPDPQASASQFASVSLLFAVDSFHFFASSPSQPKTPPVPPVFCIPLFICILAGMHTCTHHSATSSVPRACRSHTGLGAPLGTLMPHRASESAFWLSSQTCIPGFRDGM